MKWVKNFFGSAMSAKEIFKFSQRNVETVLQHMLKYNKLIKAKTCNLFTTTN